MELANIFFNAYLKIILESLIILLWGWGVLYCFSKITKYHNMLFGVLGCSGLLGIALLELFLRLPSYIVLLFPYSSYCFILQETVREFFCQIQSSYQREGIETLFQICIVFALIGPFKYLEESILKESSLLDKKRQEVEPTIATQEEEDTIVDQSPMPQEETPQKSQYRMLKEYGRIKTQVISPLEDSTVVPEISSLADLEGLDLQNPEEEIEPNYAFPEEKQVEEIKEEIEDTLDYDYPKQELEQSDSKDISKEYMEEEKPIEYHSDSVQKEEEYTIEYHSSVKEEEEEEYQPIEISLDQATSEENHSEDEEVYLAMESMEKETNSIPLEKDLEDELMEDIPAQEATSKEVLKKANKLKKKEDTDDIETEKISTFFQNIKKDAPKVPSTREYLEENQEEKKSKKILPEIQEKKTRKKSKKHEEENQAQEEMRPLLGYMIPNESLPKKIKRFKLNPEDE